MPRSADQRLQALGSTAFQYRVHPTQQLQRVGGRQRPAEQITLRLNTITELGDIVVTLTPAMSVIRSVRQGLVSVLPEAEGEIGEISGLLSSILVDAGTVGGYSLNFEAANEDAEKVLAEAAAVAESRMKEKFPEIPSGLPSMEGSSESTS